MRMTSALKVGAIPYSYIEQVVPYLAIQPGYIL